MLRLQWTFEKWKIIYACNYVKIIAEKIDSFKLNRSFLTTCSYSSEPIQPILLIPLEATFFISPNTHRRFECIAFGFEST